MNDCGHLTAKPNIILYLANSNHTHQCPRDQEKNQGARVTRPHPLLITQLLVWWGGNAGIRRSGQPFRKENFLEEWDLMDEISPIAHKERQNSSFHVFFVPAKKA